MWTVRGENWSRGTFPSEQSDATPRVIFQPLLDHALSKSFVQELGLVSAVYGKGGVAFAHDNDSLNDTFGNTASASLTRTGWTAGAGLEYAFAPNWTAKIEYDYLDFGNQTLNLPTLAFPTYSTNASLNVQEVKAGVNFKFGP